ncbi:hypothetical protein, partial [Paraburkholderia sp. SIMBA_030]|uniref:hypothetical protein n=1 Tax=Paraburkholderia sp. SIMBA_030 TaxID=3085773 RepID=UPI00397A9418
MATPRGTSHAALRKAGRTGFVSRKRGAEQPQGRGSAPQIKRAARAALRVTPAALRLLRLNAPKSCECRETGQL